MPLISVKVIKDFFTEEQKTALIKNLTDAFCRSTIEAARPYVYVMVEEVPQGKWGLGGHPLPDPDFLINDRCRCSRTLPTPFHKPMASRDAGRAARMPRKAAAAAKASRSMHLPHDEEVEP